MKTWLRWTLIVLSNGGGFTGFSLTIQNLFGPQSQNPMYLAVTLGFLILYAFVIVSGLIFVENQRRIVPLLIAFMLQTPWISSPIFAYRFTAGFHLTIGIIGGKFNGGFSLGSDWQCFLFQRLPWGFGVNLFALLIVILLLAHLFQTLGNVMPVANQSSALKNAQNQ